MLTSFTACIAVQLPIISDHHAGAHISCACERHLHQAATMAILWPAHAPSALHCLTPSK
jgi:hypothetical protein